MCVYSFNQTNDGQTIYVTFMSKVIEKLVASQMPLTYLDSNNLLPSCQSGFRKGHSTTPPSPSFRHLWCHGQAKIQLTLLALFDVSAAFDSVDHDILLRRLSVKTFGINELPLA